MMDGMGDSDPVQALSAAEDLPQKKTLSSSGPFEDWVPEEVTAGSDTGSPSSGGKKRR